MRTSLSDRPTVLLTMGDCRGIGPEVIVRALSLPRIRRLANFLVIGDLACIEKTKRALGVSAAIDLLDLGTEDPALDPLRYIDKAVALIEKKRARALVTAPVNKESITKGGVAFSGHTEYLAGLTKVKRVAMMFTGGRLKVTVVTRHIPLKDVSSHLTKKKIVDTTMLTYRSLQKNFKIRSPRVGICALNPHAGEGGLIGREEKNIIAPAVQTLKRKFPRISGPLPADSAFNLLYNGKVDSLIALYHDQAMIPVKMLGRESCVNVTLGLPFVRTSPVHGTAYDIAGRGIADPSSMIESIKFACRLSGV